MTENTNAPLRLEDRLADYGHVLRSELDADAPASAADKPRAGLLLVGSFDSDADANASEADVSVIEATATPAGLSSERGTHRGAVALMMAAALIVVAALIVPGLVADDPEAPFTMVGGDVANQPENSTGGDADGTDSSTELDGESEQKLAESSLADDSDQGVGGELPRTAAELADWANFAVRVGGSADADSELVETDTTAPSSSGDGDGELTGEGTNAVTPGNSGDASDSDTGKPDGDPKDGVPSNEGDPTDGDKGNSDNEGDPTDGDKGNSGNEGDPTDGDKDNSGNEGGDSAGCIDGAVKRGDDCVKVGTPPTSGGDCPDGAVEFGSDCYELVPPSCGDLAAAPGGDGCLKLVGSAAEGAACQPPYELNGAGDLCVKELPASATCTQGSPVGDKCLIQQPPTGASGCAAPLLQIGNQCYKLVGGTSDCGELATNADGTCRSPVQAEASSCPAGFEYYEPENVCYVYKDLAYSCTVGVFVEGQGCKTEGTPGAKKCADPSALQDGNGCYYLFDVDGDGGCGDLQPFEGKCRQAAESWDTWLCPDGSQIFEPYCYSWDSAQPTCIEGQLVDGDTRCKLTTAPTGSGCPSYALEDARGCYKPKPPTLNCGELDVAPDGVNCKQWVGDASAGSTCAAGFELVGDTCKMYVGGTPSCSGAELVESGGKSKCRYTATPSDSAGGCAAGKIELDGNCYIVEPASCGALKLDIYGAGCKKPVERTGGDRRCQAGYTVVGNECLKKV